MTRFIIGLILNLISIPLFIKGYMIAGFIFIGLGIVVWLSKLLLGSADDIGGGFDFDGFDL